MPGVIRCIIRAEDEQKQEGNQAERNGEQQKRPCLAGFADVVVHQPADEDIADYNKDHRNHRQPGEKPFCPGVDVQHIGHVLVEVVCQDGVGQQRQRRADEIADCPLGEESHIVFPDQAWRELLIKPGQTAFLAHNDPPYRNQILL